jgi:cyclopropane fatty-acyl-phospholipid synthase-like methyltransferase
MRCPICNSKGSFYKEIGKFKSLICNECYHIYVDFHNSNLLQSLYDVEFYENYMQVGYDSAFKSFLIDDFNAKIQLIKKYVAVGSSILEVGCGPGYFADMLQKEGYSLTGVELNEACKVYAKKNNIDFDNFICEDISVPDSPLSGVEFDAVISWATIEHVERPINFLSTLKRFTKKNGLILIDTGVTNKITRSIDYGYSKWLQPPHHLHVFSTDSLVRAGTLNQLSIVTFFKWFNSRNIYGKLIRCINIFFKVLSNLTLILSKDKEGFIAVTGLIIFKNNL